MKAKSGRSKKGGARGGGGYEVGYGRPPKSGQFKPGQSGNPSGRPVGAKGVDTLLDKILYEEMSVSLNGRPRSVSKFELILIRFVNDAINGDPRARAQLLEQLLRRQETGPGEGPVSFTFDFGSGIKLNKDDGDDPNDERGSDS